jgi:CRP/FNR family cyclic AMP-dependent transcriptional regulator
VPEVQAPGADLPAWLGPARQNGVLSRLDDRLVAAVIQGSQRLAMPAGAVTPGAEDEPWVVTVLRGSLRVFVPSNAGGQITLRYLRPGDMIGSFAESGPGIARSLHALEASELLRLDAARLAGLAMSDPRLAWEMVLEASRALRLAHRFYSIRAFGSVRLRVANAILEIASTRSPGGTRPGTIVTGTQHELANAAGTVREVVATALQALKREGIIRVSRGSVVILDPDRLAQVADGGFGFGPSE